MQDPRGKKKKVCNSVLTQISICSQITGLYLEYISSPFFFLQLGRKWDLSSCQISPVYSMNIVQELLLSFGADYLRKFKWLPWIALQLYSPRMRVIVQTNTWFFVVTKTPLSVDIFQWSWMRKRKQDLGRWWGQAECCLFCFRTSIRLTTRSGAHWKK